MKPLFLRFNAYDAPEVLENDSYLIENYNLMAINHYTLKQAHTFMRQYFFASDYTHVVILATDIVLREFNITKLLYEMKKNPEMKILSCVSNVDTKDFSNYLTICDETPDLEKKEWKWLSDDQKGTGIRKVIHSGLSNTIIEKEALRQTEIISDHNHDVNLCRQFNKLGIDIYADFDNYVHHKRHYTSPIWKNQYIQMNHDL